mmetsp:Transcript_38971/g.70945  ORF Transcript_38971/g.70945 Transcript_38971/m.70945 type:complete len:247 (-) Transcript_38971:46-786(-)
MLALHSTSASLQKSVSAAGSQAFCADRQRQVPLGVGRLVMSSGTCTSMSSSSEVACAGLKSSYGAMLEQSRLCAERSAKCRLTVEAEFDVACWVSLREGEVEGQDLPLLLLANQRADATYVGASSGIEGVLVVEGLDDGIPFKVCAGKPSAKGDSRQVHFAVPEANYVGTEGRMRCSRTMPAYTMLQPDAAPSAMPTLPPGVAAAPGMVVEASVSGGNLAQLHVCVRRASMAEVKRHLSTVAMVTD